METEWKSYWFIMHAGAEGQTDDNEFSTRLPGGHLPKYQEPSVKTALNDAVGIERKRLRDASDGEKNSFEDFAGDPYREGGAVFEVLSSSSGIVKVHEHLFSSSSE